MPHRTSRSFWFFLVITVLMTYPAAAARILVQSCGNFTLWEMEMARSLMICLFNMVTFSCAKLAEATGCVPCTGIWLGNTPAMENFSRRKKSVRGFSQNPPRNSYKVIHQNPWTFIVLDFSGDKHPFGSYSILFTRVPGCWPIDFAASSVVSDWGSRRFCLGYSMG
jgi:hypothetical protein